MRCWESWHRRVLRDSDVSIYISRRTFVGCVTYARLFFVGGRLFCLMVMKGERKEGKKGGSEYLSIFLTANCHSYGYYTHRAVRRVINIHKSK